MTKNNRRLLHLLGVLVFTFIAGCTRPQPVEVREPAGDIRVGDTVECPSCAGNNILVVLGIDPEGMVATVQNNNNGGVGELSILNLVKLPSPKPISTCVRGICKGDKVNVTGAVGTGESRVKVMQLFSNDTVTVQGLERGEFSTYRTSRLARQPRPKPTKERAIRFNDESLEAYKVSPRNAEGGPLALHLTCVGPTKDYTNCESYCSSIGKKCRATCTSPAGRLNQSASAWPRGSRCSGLDAGGDVSCNFNFDDELNAVPRWRCCCR